MPEEVFWDVRLDVYGPITISRQHLNLTVRKGTANPFWTKVEISKVPFGLSLQVTARASRQDDAYDAAAYFVAQALDILTLRLDLPLALGIPGVLRGRSAEHNVRRYADEQDWEDAFDKGRAYSQHRPMFSRSLSWYRKGIAGEDPIDRFWALWVVLEVVAEHYARDNERTRAGVINQICDCFDQLWGDCECWKVIPGKANKINTIYTVRNKIAHGGIRNDINAIKEVAQLLPEFKELTRTFLCELEESSLTERVKLDSRI